MQIGLTLPNRGVLFDVTTPAEMLDMAQLADETGLFDSVWVGDSIFAKPRMEAVTLLSGVAARTRRVRLGPGCMASFPLRDPVLFAYQWASLDLLAEGRTILNVCTGLVGPAGAEEAAVFGASDQQRVRRMIENIEILRRLWSEDDVSFEGQFRAFEHVTVAPKPAQDPCPIWISSNPRPAPEVPGQVDQALKRVARRADGWMTVDFPAGISAGRFAKIREFGEAFGRDMSAFGSYLYHNININPDREAALAESKRFLDLYYGPIFPMEIVRDWTIAGPPERCVEEFQRLAGYGLAGITVRITAWNQREQFNQLIEQVLPRLL